MATRQPAGTSKLKLRMSGRSFCIGEANVIERDLSLCSLAVLRQQFGVGRHFFAVEEFKQAVCAGERVLKLGDNAGNLVKRLRVLICVAQKSRRAYQW